MARLYNHIECRNGVYKCRRCRDTYEGWNLSAFINRHASCEVTNKFNARRTEYNGISYDSKAEAEYAQRLDILKAVKDPSQKVTGWERQVDYELQPAPYRIVIRVDFVVRFADGRTEIHEVKGHRTDVFELKLKMFRFKFPDITYRIINVESSKKGQK